MLHWHGGLVLIDHGASLVFHHDWARADASVARPYDATQHALIRFRPDVESAAAALAPLVTEQALTAAVADVPDEWLSDEGDFASPDDVRAAYVSRLQARLDAQGAWLPALAACAAEAPVPDGTADTSNRPAWLNRRRR
jgi:hypothetical protein